jgi:LemA protein
LSSEAGIAAAVVAVLVFWVLGAYNRLVRLRNAAAAAWAQADEALRRRAEATEALVAALREPLAGEQGALDALLATHAQAARAAGAMSTRPLLAANAGGWTEAESHYLAAASRVFALLDGHPQVRALAPVTAALAAWREGDQRLPFARQLFNDAAAAHDEAIEVFPTSLLSSRFGFHPAGRI